MSEYGQDTISDQSFRPFVLIDSAILNAPLTIDAFRVYAELKRYASKAGGCFPSYKKLGDCFRGSYPKSKDALLRQKAIAAVKELVGWGLVRKEERRKDDESLTSNQYILTPHTEWNLICRETVVVGDDHPLVVGDDHPLVVGDDQVVVGDDPNKIQLTRSNLELNKTPLPPDGGSVPIQELKILEVGQENLSTLSTTRHTNTLTLEKTEVITTTQILIPGVDVSPPKNTSAKKPKLDEEFFEPLRVLYNSSKPDRWQRCIKLNKKKISSFKRLYEELGDRTAQTMQEALCFANHDRWWRETYSNPCLDGLLVSGRVQQLSDCYKAANPNREYNADTGEIGVIDPDTGDRITDPNHIAILKGLGRI
jgi:hypothetical protein